MTVSASPYYRPTRPQDFANKGYVDARVPQTTVGKTAPTSPSLNDIWVDTN